MHTDRKDQGVSRFYPCESVSIVAQCLNTLISDSPTSGDQRLATKHGSGHPLKWRKGRPLDNQCRLELALLRLAVNSLVIISPPRPAA